MRSFCGTALCSPPIRKPRGAWISTLYRFCPPPRAATAKNAGPITARKYSRQKPGVCVSAGPGRKSLEISRISLPRGRKGPSRQKKPSGKVAWPQLLFIGTRGSCGEKSSAYALGCKAQAPYISKFAEEGDVLDCNTKRP